MLLNFADLTVLELPGFGFVLCICLFVFLPNMPHLRMGDSLDVLIVVVLRQFFALELIYTTFTVCSSANFLLYYCYVAGCHICRWGTHSSTGNRIFHLNGFSHSRLCHLTNGFALTWSPIMIMIMMIMLMMITLMVMTSKEIIMMNNEKWK